MVLDPVNKRRIAAFEAGYITQQVRTTVAQNFKFAYLFPTHIVDSKQVTITEELSEDIFDDQIVDEGKRRRITKGASARKLRFTGVGAEGLKFQQNKVEIEIEAEEFEKESFDLMGIQRRIALSLAKDIDKVVYSNILDYAQTVSDAKIAKGWSAADLEAITKDIIRIRSKVRPKFDNVDVFACGDEVQLTLASKAAALPLKWEFPANGYTVDNTLPLGGANFYYGGACMEDDELLAFSSANPGMELYYLDYKNPRVKRVPTIKDYEYCTPAINVMMYDNSDTEEEPIITMKYSYNVACHPIEKGDRMLRVQSLLS